jgi:hypothetical protein
MTHRRVIGILTLGSMLCIGSAAHAAGADVILGELVGAQVYARDNGIAALVIGTTSCNAGDKVLNWKSLPDNAHPVITMNMYRLLDGRMTQIGQSWAKHGFTALQYNVCNFGCQANPRGDGLGVGCSDPYGVINNQGPKLGSRRLINPTTGFFDGTRAQQELDAFQPTTPVDHGLQVKESDLTVPGARLFMEGQYIAGDDATAGNGNNNVSHIEVRVTQDGAGNFIIENAFPGLRPTAREVPAIRAWPYADFSVSDSWPDDGRLIVAHKVVRLSRTQYRYEYAVYNMNSERGVRAFSVPVGAAQISNVGSSAVFSHGEAWSNDPWQSTVENGRVSWATKTFQENENANAIRWGTTYNFWFEAPAVPTQADAEIGRFKPGAGPATLSIKVQAPKS